MKEADRKFANAFVVATWASVACAIAASVFGASHVLDANAAITAAAPPVAESAPNAIQEAALVVERETRCLADAIYHEARSESETGQLAVAEVVINRVTSGRYADTICGVVYQGAERSTGCQFSFTCDGSLKERIEPVAWRRAERLARNVVLGHRRNVVGSATHYHAEYVDPYWASSYAQTKRIGRHIFYSDADKRSRG